MARRDHKTETLRSVPLFATASKRDLALLSSLCTETLLEKGRLLTVQGEVGRELIVLISGTADIVRNGEVIAQVGAGQHVGEVALFDGTPRTATVVATSDIRALVFSWTEFRSAISQLPHFEAQLQATVAARRAKAPAA